MEETYLQKPLKPKGARMKTDACVAQSQEEPLPVQSFVFMPEIYRSRQTIANRLSHLNKLAGDDCPICGRNYAELSSMLYDVEQLELCVRQEMADLYDREFFGDKKKLPEGASQPSASANVHIAFDGQMLKILLPNTFVRTQKESWHLSTMIRAGLLDYEQEHGIRLSDNIHAPIHLIVKRKDVVRKNSYRDNDNLEISKIINVICSVLDTSDAANCLFYSSLFETVGSTSDSGTEIIIFENKNMKNYWSVFCVQ